MLDTLLRGIQVFPTGATFAFSPELSLLLLLRLLVQLFHVLSHGYAWQRDQLSILLDFADGLILELVSHLSKVIQVLLELVPPNPGHLLLAHDVAPHVALNCRCVHVLVRPDQV